MRALREAAGFNLTACADRAGVNKGSLLHVERGDRPLALYAGALVEVLGPEVMRLARPGQFALFDWAGATRREELDAAAAAFLRQKAQVSVARDCVEIWEAGGVFLLAVVGDKGERRAVGATD